MQQKRPIGTERAVVAVVALAVAMPAAVLHAALPQGGDVSGRTSLAGELLIAAPEMPEPFAHAVIVMAQHDRDGALGIVINKPLGTRPIAETLAALGAGTQGATGNVPILFGGPVDPNAAFALHSVDYRRAETVDIDGRIALSDAVAVLRDIGLGKGPRKSLVAFGYAGWAPAQLEAELARGAWLRAVEDPALVFDDDRSKVWTDALALPKAEP